MSANNVRIAFRRLLKIQQRRFEGDNHTIAAARDQTRKEFEANRLLDNQKDIEKRLKHARDVEEVIRRYVVQAPRSTDKDNTYNIRFTTEHALRDRHPIIIKSSLQKNREPKDD
ncbi:hypothetical protein COEREDRAFT_8280 [Coemansia reversa NRRL 1564]|uniref:Mitochondrial zinc maintenance protein 1, mitochondrial n=1 Tax=Coemansia reversa (strain ATCC 12441 / NRRL 1564) TaxID=763665 RepID=A0A2G5BBT7_COERN|nr:hypothetical protein COEREDRAFT_8280 [Coemansia reversa NRRL 1564]|eukprot:PIA16484.1 hypothetical protein COEREDRAFT_8280 [Coemansia reversa NRRL 1564]